MTLNAMCPGQMCHAFLNGGRMGSSEARSVINSPAQKRMPCPAGSGQKAGRLIIGWRTKAVINLLGRERVLCGESNRLCQRKVWEERPRPAADLPNVERIIV